MQAVQVISILGRETAAMATAQSRGGVIGLHGKAGHGKDTVARYLVDDGYKQLAFATPLKRAVEVLFDIDPNALEDRVLKEKVDDRWGASPRDLVIAMGDFFRGKFGEDVLVKRLMLDLHPCIDAGQNVVVSDVRLPVEAEALREVGGDIWKIDASTRLQEGVAPGLSEGAKNHRTECGISPHLVDAIIDNNGAMELLEKEVFRKIYGLK